MSIKLIASDMDGTVIHNYMKISDRVIKAFCAAKAQGIQTIFVTGRSPNILEPLLAINHTGPVICSNGAALVELERHDSTITPKIIKTNTLTTDQATTIIDKIRRQIPGTKFSIATARKLHNDENFDSAAEAAENARRSDKIRHRIELDKLDEDGGALLIFARNPAENLHEFSLAVKKILGDTASVSAANPLITEVTIVANGVNKAHALEEYADSYDIRAEEVLAFGDMPNDLEMLQWAGHGHAMGNAHPTVKEAIGLTAPTVSEDGVAHIIEHYLATHQLTAIDKETPQKLESSPGHSAL